jgi:hypothetical protein
MSSYDLTALSAKIEFRFASQPRQRQGCITFPRPISYPVKQTVERSAVRPGPTCYTAAMRLAMIFILFAHSAFSQTVLQRQIRVIAADAHGRVSVACSLPDSTLNCDLDPHAHPPMQSVFKVPLAITALRLVEQGKFSLDEAVRFLASDRILPHTYSPLQDNIGKRRSTFCCANSYAWRSLSATTPPQTLFCEASADPPS